MACCGAAHAVPEALRAQAERCLASVGVGEAVGPDPETLTGPACEQFFLQYEADPALSSARPGSPEAVRDLLAWWHDAERPADPIQSLRPDQVSAVLAGLAEVGPKPPQSWWDRFKSWMQSWLQQRSRDARAPDWLRQLLDWITPDAVRIVLWTLLAALTVALVAIVVVELRAAGVLRRHAAAPARPRAGLAAVPPSAAAPGLSAIAALPLSEQPAALLRFAIAALVARGLLPQNESLTNGEMLGLLNAGAAGEAPVFRRLTLAADAAVYGAVAPESGEMRALLQLAPAFQAGSRP